MRSRILAIGFALCVAGVANAQSEFNYPYNEAPLKKHEKLGTEFLSLREDGFKQPASNASLQRQVEILENLIKLEPEWIDGYWLLGEASFQHADSFTDPKDLKQARTILVRGQEVTEACLKKAPTNPLCKMFLGAAMGKMASIDGIIPSLKKAETIERLWLDITNSNVNHRLSPTTTLQGSASYALGIFYRLVPDVAMIKWMFGTKGDINKSVTFLKSSVNTDGPNPCNLLMLGVSLICSAKGDVKEKDGQEGLKVLAEAKKLPVSTSIAKTCSNDVSKIEKDPSLACGYETSRQQKPNDEEIKNINAEKEKK